MGWFWADTPVAAVQTPAGHAPVTPGREPPPGCPMHQKSADALTHSKPVAPPSTSGCPVPHDQRSGAAPASSGGCPVPHASQEKESKSILSQLNPLNYMFPDLSQERAKDQTYALPTSREPSTIPRGSGDGNWEYPSPQQMYNALLRKGYEDTDITAVESMVSVHNFLNEGAWKEILGWENRFARGLYKGWQICKRGEEHYEEELDRHWDGSDLEPSLVRFQGRPKELTPKATMLQVMGWMYPSKFGTEPPFDRHDWYVAREQNGERKEIRYIIDYYAGADDPEGEPVFFLDVRPAATLQGSAERIIRWSSDVWWKAIGGDERERNPRGILSLPGKD